MQEISARNFKIILKNEIIIFFFIIITGVNAKTERIVGGSKASIRDYPHLASFRTAFNLHFCSGSIISTTHILSAAHCFIGYTNQYYKIKAITGTANTELVPGNIYSIHHVINHPQFSWMNSIRNPNDICIVKLTDKIIFNEVQNKIKLPSRNMFNGNLAVIIGWGISHVGKRSFPDKLMRVPMTLYDYHACSDKYPLIMFKEQFCSIDDFGAGVSEPDSGGSVVSNGEIYGIVSMANKCVNNLPDIHTNVYSYLTFIKAVIGKDADN